MSPTKRIELLEVRNEALERELAETRAVLADCYEGRGWDPEKIARAAYQKVIASMFQNTPDDEDANTLERLFIQAGWLWACDEEHCGYVNPVYVEECEAGGCSGRRPEDR